MHSPGLVLPSSEDPHPASACCAPRNPWLCRLPSLPSPHPAFTLSPLRTQIAPGGEQRLQQGQDTGFPGYLHTLGATRSARRLLCPVLHFGQVQLGCQQQCPVELPPSSRCGTPAGWVGLGVGRDGAPEIHSGAQGGWLRAKSRAVRPQLSLCSPAAPAPGDLQCPTCLSVFGSCTQNSDTVMCPKGTSHCYQGYIALRGGEC